MKWLKGKRLYIGILAVLFGVVIFLEANQPQPLDWGLYFSRHAETPYGDYLLYDHLNVLFPQQRVKSVKSKVRHVLNRPDPNINNYVFINEFFEPDSLDAVALINFMDGGGQVFIAANWFDGYFAEYYNLKTENHYTDYEYEFPDGEEPDVTAIGTYQSAELNFENEGIRQDSAYLYKYNLTNYHFTSYGGSSNTILGRDEFDNVNFVHIRSGSGDLYISCVPRAYTNYFIAHPRNHEYVFNALSYLPISGVYWDEYYKDDRSPSGSPLRFIMEQEPLRWAFIIFIVSILVFMIFTAKRKQRIIPVLQPNTNTTVEFVGIISRLYYQRFNHGNIAHKKIVYFLEHIRTKYQLRTNAFDDEFIIQLSYKSNITRDRLRDLFGYIDEVRRTSNLGQAELVNLNSKIEQFMRDSKR